MIYYANTKFYSLTSLIYILLFDEFFAYYTVKKLYSLSSVFYLLGTFCFIYLPYQYVPVSLSTDTFSKLVTDTVSCLLYSAGLIPHFCISLTYWLKLSLYESLP